MVWPHSGSAHSQTRAACRGRSSRAEFAIRSLTSRNADSVLAMRSSSLLTGCLYNEEVALEVRLGCAEWLVNGRKPERVSGFLRQMGRGRIEEFSTGTPPRSTRLVPSAPSSPDRQVARLRLRRTLIVVLVPGDRRADLDKIAARRAPRRPDPLPDEVERATGFVAGAVCAVPAAQRRPCFRRPRAARSQAGLDRSRLPSHMARSPRET